MELEITDKELEFLKDYKKNYYAIINQLLSNDFESDIENNAFLGCSKDSIAKNIEIIKKVYELIIKYHVKNFSQNSRIFYRASNMSEIDKLKNDSEINIFLLASTDKESTKNLLLENINRPVLLEIEVPSDISYIIVENDVIIAPFINVDIIEEELDNPEIKKYKIFLSKQNMPIIDGNDSKRLYEKILNRIDIVLQKLKNCNDLDNENAINYENIRKLEQLIAKHNFAMEQENYEKDTTEEEKQNDLDDIERINNELANLKKSVSEIFNNRLENIQFVNNWKNDLIAYLKNEFENINKLSCKEPEKRKGKIEVKKEENKKEEKNESPEIGQLKNDCNDNINTIKILLNNISDLILRQQNHARIADELDSNYKALNNAFEMKNYAEELNSLVQAISVKIDNLSKDNKTEIEKIEKVNLQISTLLNYLNNAKTAVSKKINRFDEINIIEENELKKEIAETIKNIRCEAELKKLNDDLDIIEDKSSFKKFIGRFNGRNKLDEVMFDQIKVRQNAIRKTFKTKMPLAYNYSIHELIAEIEMFIKENQDDELVLEDVSALRKIRDILKKNFVIIDSKVISIVDQKTGKNLPLASRKLSKKELIEIDTYRFLNRYGYDKSYDCEEPEYQDTMANEIKRIVDYIKSSNVL